MRIVRQHPFTREMNERELDITPEQYDAYCNGALIQHAFPQLSADDREFILTGITNWDEIVPSS
jgi:hypothetical protein